MLHIFEILQNINKKFLVISKPHGEGGESFIKDVLADSFNLESIKREEIHKKIFSYRSKKNSTNPPDLILSAGEVIEIKKVSSMSSSIQLNSSYPKRVLYRNDPALTKECKSCDGGDWEKKDLIYCIAHIPKGDDNLKSLWFIDSDIYVANNKVYEDLTERISNSLKKSFSDNTSETKELARFNEVDPNGASHLRVRPMWMIKSPLKLFNIDHIF